MGVTKQQIIDAVRALPVEEQAELVEELSSSLPVTLDDDLIATIREREEAFRNGAPGIPADEVFDELLSK